MKRWPIVLAVALVVSGGTVALAAIPDSNGVIHACRDSKSGLLRVIDTEAGQRCTSRETSLDWRSSQPKVLHDPYEVRLHFDVPNDGQMHAFNVACNPQTGQDAVTGLTAFIIDGALGDLQSIRPYSPPSNLSVSNYGYANSGYVYAKGNDPTGPTSQMEVDLSCARVA
jgi:hypothetical protein